MELDGARPAFFGLVRNVRLIRSVRFFRLRHFVRGLWNRFIDRLAALRRFFRLASLLELGLLLLSLLAQLF